MPGMADLVEDARSIIVQAVALFCCSPVGTVLVSGVTSSGRGRPTAESNMSTNLPDHSSGLDADFLVIGSGLAGLYASLQASRHGSVILITKAQLEMSNSSWAQGGIAAALDPEDNPTLHEEDTLQAGRGLCRLSAVEILAEEGPARVHDLLERGVPFDRGPDGTPDLGLEGGHQRRRILHANGGATGQAVVQALVPYVQANPAIEIWESARAVSLLTADARCGGAVIERGGAFRALRARATILATGGACGLYSPTTNPDTATGDGIALAYSAGAAVADMEFVQFHPTAFAMGHPAFLLSEALRGEGAELWNAQGERFMSRYDPKGELAPRDVVARAVAHEMESTGKDHVFLRLEHLSAHAREQFATLFAGLRSKGFDPLSHPVPVAPAAHFLMGGVAVDLEGRTSLPGLYACGEVSCTGVHGANRLASNSLLECLVFGYRAAEAAKDEGNPPRDAQPASMLGPTLSSALRRELGRRLFHDAGIERSMEGLVQLRDWLTALPPSPEGLVADRIVEGALAREESRGSQYRSDFPVENPRFLGHFVQQKGRPTELVRWE